MRLGSSPRVCRFLRWPRQTDIEALFDVLFYLQLQRLAFQRLAGLCSACLLSRGRWRAQEVPLSGRGDRSCGRIPGSSKSCGAVFPWLSFRGGRAPASEAPSRKEDFLLLLLLASSSSFLLASPFSDGALRIYSRGISIAFFSLTSPALFFLLKKFPSLSRLKQRRKKPTFNLNLTKCSASPSPARSSPSSPRSRRPARECSPTGPTGSRRTTAAPRRG